jgi:D-alanine-D-alanine ligase
MKRLRVGVLYGGRSSEHEVSLASAAAVMANLDPNRYDALPIYIHRDGHWSLAERPPTNSSAADVITQSRSQPDEPPTAHTHSVHLISHPGEETLLTIQSESAPSSEGTRAIVKNLTLDVVFPVLHGPYGEDGTLQGLLELSNVPYVGAGVFASAAAMDKTATKVLFEGHKLPVVDYAVVSGQDWENRRTSTLDRLVERLTFPMFVKPANLGSSIGISKVSDRIELESAIDLARQFDRKVLVEVAVPRARELECAVLGNDDPVASVPGEIIPAGEFYDYEAKYLHDDSTRIIPAILTVEQTAQIQTMALTAYHAIDCAGMARVDFLMDGTNDRLFLNELNTIPGFTTISMYSKMWAASGLEYPALLDRLIELACDRHAHTHALRTSEH